MTMKVFLLLADAAQAVAGKLYILGGGWSTIMAGAPFAVAVKVYVPWNEGTQQHKLKLELVDSDGNPFEAPVSETQKEPLVIEQDFCTGIPPNVKAGTPLDYVYTFTAVGLPLEPNMRYEWRLSVDGESDPDWTLAFNTAPTPLAQAA
ncbi:MAG TPA: hypothetical protein VFW80_02965 [Gaiellaceae bacterium]|nr:hypothetical protein [Gaiellaceae bacterium]